MVTDTDREYLSQVFRALGQKFTEQMEDDLNNGATIELNYGNLIFAQVWIEKEHWYCSIDIQASDTLATGGTFKEAFDSAFTNCLVDVETFIEMLVALAEVVEG